jgi:acetyltransferase
VLATDALIRAGGTLAELSAASLETLNATLSAHWSHSNPIDILGDAEPTRFAEALKTTLADSDSDGCLVMLTPQAMTDPTKTAQAVVVLGGPVNRVSRFWLAGWGG